MARLEKKIPARRPSKRAAISEATLLAEAIRVREEHERSIVDAGWTDSYIDKIGADAMASPDGRRLSEDIRAARGQHGKTKLRALPRPAKRAGSPKAR